jgi:membrane dipeptidase
MLARIPPLVLGLAFLSHCGGDGDDDKGRLDLVGPSPQTQPPAEPPAAKSLNASSLHEETFVIDLIQDLAFRKRRDGWTLTTPEAQVNLEKLRRGGVDLLFAALQLQPGQRPRQALEAELSLMDELMAGTDGRAALVSSLGDARAARDRGVLPVMLLVEGADGLSGSGDELYELKRRGLTMIGLVGPRGNRFGESAAAPREPAGLTEEGAELVAACRDHGVLVDLTHASSTTFWDVLVGQGSLAVVSHGAAAALRKHPRNLDDLQILALARYGGLLGLVFNPELIKPGQSPAADIGDVVAQLQHARRLRALSAMALGTDYDGIRAPAGLEDVSRLPALTAALTDAGLAEAEIRGILGDNAARVIDAVERNVGAGEAGREEPMRPVDVDCEVVIGEVIGNPLQSCDRLVVEGGPTIPAATRQKLRVREMGRTPTQLELFGEPGTPWQVEAQNLDGKVLIRRVVALGDDGQGVLPLPAGRGLTRIFLSPTRSSVLREAVVWGR